VTLQKKIIADIEISGWLSGLNFTWLVRMLWPSIPVIATTGKSSVPAALPVKTPVLTKPLCPVRLREAMKIAA
jgi:hypothetical protein